MSFNVTCFTQGTRSTTGIETIAYQLLKEVDLIEKDGLKIRAKNKKCTIAEEIVHFTFDIEYTEAAEDSENNMTSIEQLNLRSDAR